MHSECRTSRIHLSFSQIHPVFDFRVIFNGIPLLLSEFTRNGYLKDNNMVPNVILTLLLRLSFTKNLQTRTLYSDFVVVLSAWRNLNSFLTMDSLYLARSSNYSLTHRNLLDCVNVEAFSLKDRVLFQIDSDYEIAEVSTYTLVTFFFDSKEHAVIDTIWNLDEKLGSLVYDTLASTGLAGN